MKTVKDILQAKGSGVHTITQGETVFAALAMLAEQDIGALVVVDAQKAVVGLISERDYTRKVILKGLSSLETAIKDIMTEKVVYVHPGRTVEECMALITEKRCRYLPVLENGELLGLVSIGDLVKATIEEKEFLINQLTHYIQAG